jgi:tight adherence protein B
MAVAQDQVGPVGEPPTLLRAVDNEDLDAPASLQLMHSGSVEGIKMTQEGEEAPIGEITALAAVRPVSVVFVVDSGAVMQATGGLQAAKEGIAAALEAFGEDDSYALVEAGDTANTLSDLTDSPARLNSALEDLVASADGGSAVFGALRSSTDILASARGGQTNVVLLTSGQNVNDGEFEMAAQGDLTTVGAGTFVQGWGGGFAPGAFSDLVEATGGSINVAGEAAPYIEGVRGISDWLTLDQYAVEFTSVVTESGQVVESEVTLGDTTIQFAYVSGNLDQGASALQPYEPNEPSGITGVPIFRGSTGQLIIVIFGLLAVVGIVYSLALIFGPDEGALSNVLRPYAEGPAQGGDDDYDDEDSGSALARTALLQRAVALTESVADRQGYLSRTEAALERADMPLRAAEALFFYITVVVVTGLVSLLLFPPMGALILVLAAALLPPAFVNFKASRRRKKFQALLPDMLQLLSGTLRAGYSLMQGVEAVSTEVGEPMGKELRRVVTESRLGRPLEEALDGVATRMGSGDFAWAVMAIRIQREVGGNLSELLLTVAETMVARERLRRDVSALTAEGRVSAMVLGLLPVGLGAALFALNPDYMAKLLNTGLGNILLGLSIFAMLVGFAWMRQIIKIDI